jgi:hypothetical protein
MFEGNLPPTFCLFEQSKSGHLDHAGIAFMGSSHQLSKKKTSMGKASGFTEHLVGMGLVIGAPVGQEHTNF